MSLYTSSVSVVLTGVGDADALRNAILAVADATNIAEASGLDVHITIADDRRVPGIPHLFNAVSGAEIMDTTGESVLSTVAAAIEKSQTDLVWLTSASHPVKPASLLWLIAALEPDDVALAVPDREKLGHIVIRGTTLAQIGDISQLATTDANNHDSVLTAIKDAVDSAGLRVAHRLDSIANETAPSPSLLSPGVQGATIEGGWQGSILLGANSYCGVTSAIRKWGKSDSIIVNDYTSIAEEVSIIHSGYGGRSQRDDSGAITSCVLPGGHHLETATTFPVQFLTNQIELVDDHTIFSRPMVIGPDCWFGYASIAAGPINIGAGAVISTGSVVLRDVLPYAVVAGNPAKVVRMRFSQPTIDALLRIRWWDWPAATVRERWRDFTGPIDAFVQKYDVT